MPVNSVSGYLHKMTASFEAPVRYSLVLSDHEICLNNHLNQLIRLNYIGGISCIQCGRQTNKSFQQGYCFPCMRRINECDNCMLHPERCHVESGECPLDDWAHQQCHAPHIVYLANSSGLKVGITRATNVPMRWIDQGAIAALPIAEVSNRRQAGLVEVMIKQYMNDKTNWRTMLKNEVEAIDLQAARDQVFEQIDTEFALLQAAYDPGAILLCEQGDLCELSYPVIEYPLKIVSHSLDKTPMVSGVLKGIKGQYLLLDTGVINIRKFGGYQVEVSFGS